MTAVASPPTFSNINRPAWGGNAGHGGQNINSMNPDDINRMFMPRKTVQRTNSSSSINSNASASSTSTVGSSAPQTNGASTPAGNDLNSLPFAGARKRPQNKAPWPPAKGDVQLDMMRSAAGRPQMVAGINGMTPMQSSPMLASPGQIASQQGMARPLTESLPASGQPVLYLLSLNGTFERKTISVPFFPDVLRIGRQTNAKTVPTPINGFFDSKVLSRQHAEIYADRQGKIWIRDVKSSNGTFVNGTRLSQENRESDPHELQTGDHLELGIDIVSEDQKTVVHHKVAAKVEHAGFLSPSSNLLDMNFGDLDPANGGMMMQPQGPLQFRGRTGIQASMASNGRMLPAANVMGVQTAGLNQQRGFWLSPISTEQIVKKLQNEMRTARLQSNDLARTGQFIHALLSKEDVKDLEKPEAPEPPKAPMVNGNGPNHGLYRSDVKPRFSDPPAPPPSQPLPEKPDVPSLKRGITERPKSNPPNGSPVRQDNNSQILQLTEALNKAKEEIESQTSRMKDLEEMLQSERQRRESAEELAKKLEDDVAAASKPNGVAIESTTEETALEEAFEPPVDQSQPEAAAPAKESEAPIPPQVETVEASATHFQSQIESLLSEMKDLRNQLESYKARAETAEAERDSDRKTLAEMVQKIRQDEEAREAASLEKARSRSKTRSITLADDLRSVTSEESGTLVRTPSTSSSAGDASADMADQPTLSRANTITPYSGPTAKGTHNEVLMSSMPYASMIGVVLIGMGLMAYINGFQPSQPRLDR